MSLSNIERMDVNLLYSIVNMKLRNDYNDLEDLCLSMDIDRGQLLSRLESAGFCYSSSLARFTQQCA